MATSLSFYVFGGLAVFALFYQKVDSSTLSTSTHLKYGLEENIFSSYENNTQDDVSSSLRAIITAVPNEEMAKEFGRDLVKEGLAAIVNIFPNPVSFYVWDNEVRELSEPILLIYTRLEQYEKVEQYLKEHHPHVEPGIVMLPIVGGSHSFLSWIEDQTSGESYTNSTEQAM